MTKDQISIMLEQVRGWPDEDRAELAAYAREIEARRTGVYVLDEEERAAIADARRTSLVSDADMQAFWRRHGIR